MSDKIIERYKAILKRQDLWRSTPLLRVLSGRLQKMLARMEQEKKSVLPTLKETPDLVTVYVVLYYQGGGSLSIWESQLKRIQHSVKSRPIFLTELEAKSCIFDRFVEGFAKLAVPKSAILINEGGYYIKDNIVTISSVKEFFWQNSWYIFQNGRLVPQVENID